jgi:hypothetical protein
MSALLRGIIKAVHDRIRARSETRCSNESTSNCVASEKHPIGLPPRKDCKKGQQSCIVAACTHAQLNHNYLRTRLLANNYLYVASNFSGLDYFVS